MVQNAVDTLKSGKACGNDGLSAKHFIHSDRRITILLSIFFNRVISHFFLKWKGRSSVLREPSSIDE